MTIRLRNFVFTLNNYTDLEYDDILKSDLFKYLIIGKERGESGTDHLQGYAELRERCRMSKIKILMPRAHIEPRRGTAKQASEYCKKDNNFVEIGTLSEQGKRTDLIEMKDDILEGRTTVDEILIDNPNAYHQYGRTLDKIEHVVLSKKYKTEMTECDWITGPTGSGKSHYAFKDFSPETHYLYKDDKGWWDNYQGQETVIINDFKGEIRYGLLLQLIDKWPFEVSRRGRPPYPFTSKKIIITSIMRPEEVYYNLNEKDGIEQLLRRINIIDLKVKYEEPKPQKFFPIFKQT